MTSKSEITKIATEISRMNNEESMSRRLANQFRAQAETEKETFGKPAATTLQSIKVWDDSRNYESAQINGMWSLVRVLGIEEKVRKEVFG